MTDSSYDGTPLSVLSIDDDAAFQKQVSLLLAAYDIALLPSVSSLEDGLRFVASDKPDVVLMDIWVNGENQVGRIGAIKRASPDSQVIVVSLHPEEEYRRAALAEGAFDYVSKAQAGEELAQSVLRACGRST